MCRMRVLVLACAVGPAIATTAFAQSPRAIEVGGQFTAVRSSAPTANNPDATFMDTGLGGRFAWMVNDTLAVETASDFFPGNRHNVRRGGRKSPTS